MQKSSLHEIDLKVEESLQFVKSYAPNISEWRVLKKELLKNIPSESRKLFSTRDPVTKATNFNEFEQLVADRWTKLTGVTIIR